jgi:hypothetical protein
MRGLDPRIHLLAKSFDRFALPDRRGFAPAVDLSRRERDKAVRSTLPADLLEG